MANITITLEKELADLLREKAGEQGDNSISSFVREALSEKLDRDRASVASGNGRGSDGMDTLSRNISSHSKKTAPKHR